MAPREQRGSASGAKEVAISNPPLSFFFAVFRFLPVREAEISEALRRHHLFEHFISVPVVHGRFHACLPRNFIFCLYKKGYVSNQKKQPHHFGLPAREHTHVQVSPEAVRSDGPKYPSEKKLRCAMVPVLLGIRKAGYFFSASSTDSSSRAIAPQILRD